jgi:hypothetical protein
VGVRSFLDHAKSIFTCDVPTCILRDETTLRQVMSGNKSSPWSFDESRMSRGNYSGDTPFPCHRGWTLSFGQPLFSVSEAVITLLFLGGESGAGVQHSQSFDRLKCSVEPLTNVLMYGPDPSIPSEVLRSTLGSVTQHFSKTL